MQEFSPVANYAIDFINQTNSSVFLTGNAGTGKTTLLHHIVATTHKKTVVVAPTGVAALNAKGVTIHSMFGLPFGAFVPDFGQPHFSEALKYETKSTLTRHFNLSSVKKSVIKSMELLIVDEVSMLRADVLDAMDFMLQSVRKNKTPFGGVQVLFIGDLLQLPPVMKNDEWNVLKSYYKGKFFFHAQVIAQQKPVYVELTKIFRQSDERFVNLLNKLRNNVLTEEDRNILNAFVVPQGTSIPEAVITLTTHNRNADSINQQALADLDGKLHYYSPEIVGDFPDRIYPVEQNLELKVGAQVMFIKNDLSAEKHFYNGKMAKVVSLSPNEILVKFQDQSERVIEVQRYEWKNIRFKVNADTREIDEEVLGTFVHYPIKLAWAITVHKSQGLTFERAALDVSSVFVAGQAYVALSRLRSLEGLMLLAPISANNISTEADVVNFAEQRLPESQIPEVLDDARAEFIHSYLRESFNFSEMASAWRVFKYDSAKEQAGSNTGKQKDWSSQIFANIEKMLSPSEGFMHQINKLFSDKNLDKKHIHSRVEAACDYFLPQLTDNYFQLLLKMEEVASAKKAKALYNDLLTIENAHLETAIRVQKAVFAAKAFAENQPLTKEMLSSPQIREFRQKILKQVQEITGTNAVNEASKETYTKTKKAKSSKKDTVEETWELYQKKNSLKEIAVIRKLTPQTIGNHFCKLIADGRIKPEEIFSFDRMEQLAKVFEGYEEQSLSPLKEKVGDEFSWVELKMYNASRELA